MEEDGLVLDLSNTLTQQEEATQGPQDNAFNIEGSSWYFKDGDTLGNTETGEDIRFRGIDTRETAKFLEDSGFQGGELGGDAATADVVVTGPRAWQHDRVAWNKLLQRSSQYGREKVDLRDCTTSTRTGADAAVVKEEHNGDGGIASVLVHGRNGVVGGKRRRGGGAD